MAVFGEICQEEELGDLENAHFPFYEALLVRQWICRWGQLAAAHARLRDSRRRMVRDAVYAEAHGTQVDFLLNTGDMPTDGRRPSHWKTFLRENKVERPLLVDFPYLVVSGNHERTNDLEHGLPNYQAIFDYPLFYVLDFPDAVLFVVDSNVIIDQYQFIDDDVQEKLFQKWFISDDPEQPGWLERELAVRHKTFKMVALHHPPISFGKHHGNWTNPAFGKNNSQKRRQLIKLFQEQDVQVVFCGHEHLYEHSIVTAHSNGNTNQSAVHFIISGGGGAPVRDATDAKNCQNSRRITGVKR